MLCSDEHSLNTLSPIVVTLLGISILLSDEQPQNASSPIVVTLLGISMLCSDEQPLNAQSQIVVTLFGMVYFFNFVPSGNIKMQVKSLLNNIPSIDS